MANVMHRIILLCGLLLIILSFALIPWLVVDPGEYLPPGVQKALDVVIDALERWGPWQAQTTIGLLDRVTRLRGWMFLDTPAVGWGLKALVVAPTVLAALSLVWELIYCWVENDGMVAFVSLAQATASIVLLALLVAQIPAVERLGATHDYVAGLVVALFGVRVGWGLWATLLGLALVAGGALWRMFGAGRE